MATMNIIPDQFAPVEIKETDKYGLECAKGFHGRYVRGQGYVPYSSVGTFQTYSDYYEGNQDMNQYIARFRGEGEVVNQGSSEATSAPVGRYGGTDKGLARKGYSNVSFTNVNPTPKLMSTVKAVLNEADYKVDVSSTAPDAIKRKDVEKWRLYYGSKYLNPMRKEAGLPLKNFDWQPQNKEELEIYEKLHGFKLPLEIGLMRISDDVFNCSHWEDLFEEFKKSALQTKFMAGRVKTNHDGAVVIEWIPTGNFIAARLDKQKYDELPWAGHVVRRTISDIAEKMIAKGYTIEQIKGIAKTHAKSNWAGDVNNIDYEFRDPVTSRFLWYDWFVPVFCFEMRSTDKRYFRKYTKKDGTKKFTEVKAKALKEGNNPNTEELNTKLEESVYCGEWIIDTDYMLEWERQKYIMRNSDGTCALSYFCIEVEGLPMVQRLKSYVDQHQMAFLKFQAALLADHPEGYAFDTSLLAQIQINGADFSPLENIQMLTETGNMFISTTEMMIKNRISPKDAIVPLTKNLNKAKEWLEIMASQELQMRKISGISEMMDAGGDKKPDLVGLAQMEQISTSNALYAFKQALTYIKRKAAEKGIAKARVLLEFNEKSREYYNGKIGENYVEAIREYKDLSLNSIGILLKAAPTAERKRAIMEVAAMALQNSKNGSGQALIDYDEYLMVEKLVHEGYLDFATHYMSVSIARNRKKQAEEAAAAAQQNGQIQMQSAQAAQAAKTESEVAKIEAKGNVEARLKQMQAEIDKMLQAQKIQGDKENLVLEGTIEATTGKDVRGNI